MPKALRTPRSSGSNAKIEPSTTSARAPKKIAREVKPPIEVQSANLSGCSQSDRSAGVRNRTAQRVFAIGALTGHIHPGRVSHELKAVCGCT
jgi:hypothetical protein